MSSLFMPMFPMLGIILYFVQGSQWMLLIPLLFSYVVIPFLDYAIGSDNNNPPATSGWTPLGDPRRRASHCRTPTEHPIDYGSKFPVID